jgi:hypothetical protein
MNTTSERFAIIKDAMERTRNLEPFTTDELRALAAIPGVKVKRGPRVRKGTILNTLTVNLMGPASHPDAITNPVDAPTVEGTNITRPL